VKGETTEGNRHMPRWIVPVLKWGGVAVAALAVITLVYVWLVLPTLSAPAPGQETAPVTRYWVLLTVGVMAAGIGAALDRKLPSAGAEK
jgi:hypothetical protein